MPLAQHVQPHMSLVTESKGSSASVVPELREIIRKLDSNMPVYDVRTMEDFYENRAIKAPTIIVQTVGSMGLMGLLLTMVGLYGLVAYSVSRRSREIGIRMAIGADRIKVMRMVLKQGCILAVCGIVAGTVLSLGADRLLNAMFGGSGMDMEEALIIFLWMPLALFSTTLLASYLPARRASLVDPMKALREE
jgi:ABC-type antimicrobial peptide transport system permease subunit